MDKVWKRRIKRQKIPKLPKNIPLYPDQTYKSEWEGWAIFLGNPHKKKKTYFRPYEEARAFASKLGLVSYTEWKIYCKGEMPQLPKLPNDISSAPQSYYKQWNGWPDWLGKPVVERNYVSYSKASEVAVKNGIKTRKEWQNFVEKKLPLSKVKLLLLLPKYPEKEYRKTKEWTSWCDFTGQPEKKQYRGKRWTYTKARAFLKSLKIKSRRQWYQYVKGELPHLPSLPAEIPKSPVQSYKKKEWKSWADFLGTKNKPKNRMKFWSYERAKSHVSKLNIKSVREWDLYTKGKLPGRDLKPEELPADPRRTYKEKWQGYPYFLSKTGIEGKAKQNQ